MKIAYFDCYAGISGDMALGALVDAGLEPARLQSQLDRLGVPGLTATFHPTSKHELVATQAEVRVADAPVPSADEHHLELEHADGRGAAHTHRHPAPAADRAGHRHLADILGTIRGTDLEPEVKEGAIKVFQRLAAAEAQVHGVAPDQVHLHEVGALDAIADIVGTIAGLRLLGVDAVYSSPLRFGTGLVKCAHGSYPVPVPGVLALCAGVPCEQTQIRAELVTPTGAALITELATSFGPPPLLRQERVGYGAGRRDLEEIPNLLRVRIGETISGLAADRVVLVEANIDDMNPEIYGYLLDLLLEQGARDVYITPIHMKKGRPANLLSVLVDEAQLDAIANTILGETTTIGVRYHQVERRKLERSITTVSTPYGPVRVKVSWFDGQRRAAPEYEDCARLARQQRVPIQAVYAAARAATIEE